MSLYNSTNCYLAKEPWSYVWQDKVWASRLTEKRTVIELVLLLICTLFTISLEVDHKDAKHAQYMHVSCTIEGSAECLSEINKERAHTCTHTEKPTSRLRLEPKGEIELQFLNTAHISAPGNEWNSRLN